MRPESRPPFAYEHRHRPLDATVLHELLCKGYPLEEDPAAICTELRAAARQGSPPRLDWAPFARQVAAFYRERGRSVPDDVREVFGVPRGVAS